MLAAIGNAARLITGAPSQEFRALDVPGVMDFVVSQIRAKKRTAPRLDIDAPVIDLVSESSGQPGYAPGGVNPPPAVRIETLGVTPRAASVLSDSDFDRRINALNAIDANERAYGEGKYAKKKPQKRKRSVDPAMKAMRANAKKYGEPMP